jgi:hypothetical protein
LVSFLFNESQRNRNLIKHKQNNLDNPITQTALKFKPKQKNHKNYQYFQYIQRNNNLRRNKNQSKKIYRQLPSQILSNSINDRSVTTNYENLRNKYSLREKMEIKSKIEKQTGLKKIPSSHNDIVGKLISPLSQPKDYFSIENIQKDNKKIQRKNINYNNNKHLKSFTNNINDFYNVNNNIKNFMPNNTFKRIFSQNDLVDNKNERDKYHFKSLKYRKANYDNIKDLENNQRKFRDKDENITIKPNYIPFQQIAKQTRENYINNYIQIYE